MKLNIIKIGNSKGVRIPKALLSQCGFKDKVIVKLEDGNLVLIPDSSSSPNPRKGWKKKFELANSMESELIDPELFALDSDDKDWTW
ncbi:hypothetical protein A3F66_05155 [candidate division TM6 bacterium RIFCSPHIGHO2_12_FULL_32_22]|nr:MAG: hypothetical protein A3F66_05155 [candidate division TM6 bacterium RIFCSPHIGHO2_12_FULL_32_22]